MSLKGNQRAKGNKGNTKPKTYYNPEYTEQAFKYCLLGATDTQIAEFLRVPITTFDNWKRTNPELMEALYNGRAKADAEISHSLYQKAKGYVKKESVLHVIDGKVVETVIDKYYPPDTQAAKIWLHNRQRVLWKQQHNEEDQPPIIIAVNVTSEETKRIASDLRSEFLQIAG